MKKKTLTEAINEQKAKGFIDPNTKIFHKTPKVNIIHPPQKQNKINK